MPTDRRFLSTGRFYLLMTSTSTPCTALSVIAIDRSEPNHRGQIKKADEANPRRPPTN